MSKIKKMADRLECSICMAEVAYKSGQINRAVKYALSALKVCTKPSETVALKLFIARAYSKLGYYDKSNTIYRALLRENVYIPPIVLGLLYNNFKTASAEKVKLNVGLIKTCLHLQ